MNIEAREYPTRPLVGIGIVVLRDNAVLLIRRARPPAQGAWSLPGGAQRLGETAEQAARRELAEETGLAVGPLHLAGHVDSLHHDPGGRLRFHYTILDFCAVWTDGEPKAGGDATDAMWAAFGDLERLELWPEARRIVELSVARLCPQSAAPDR
jgi:ADP-ribose pyrophosphatase YjhB (NUDIX family)